MALVGHCLNKQTSLAQTARKVAKRHGITNIDLIRTYLGLICLSKSDFEAVEQARHDPFFKAAMGIKQSPSSARLRQRFDEDARTLIPLLEAYTYKGHDGYAPIAAYLGREGWCLGCELRYGNQHANNEFIHTLDRVVPRVRSLTSAPVLVRLDSAHDAATNRQYFRQCGFDYLIKWNPRSQDGRAWMEKAEVAGAIWCHTRPGKKEVFVTESVDGTDDRLVVKVTVRESDANDQLFLEPEVSLKGRTTSLKPEVADTATVIALYRDHATSEQLHSEFKTDLDLERLPSGKFDTNDLVMAFAVLAYHILRWMGQHALQGPDAPVRHNAKRRRLKTVMQELMYMACRLVSSGRQLTLRFGRYCPAFKAFSSVYGSV